MSDLPDKIERLESLLMVVSSTDNLNQVLKSVVEAICVHSNWTMSSIMRVDPISQLSHLVCENNPLRAGKGPLEDRWPLDASPVGKVIQGGKPLVITDVQHDCEFPDYQQDALLWGYQTVVILSLRCRSEEGQAMALSVQSVDKISVSESELRFLSTAARIASVAIEKAQVLRSERDVVQRLSIAAQTRNGLMELVLSNAAPEQITAEIADLLNVPIIFFDQTQNILVQAIGEGQATRLPNSAKADIAAQLRNAIDETNELHLPDLQIPAFTHAQAHPLHIGTIFVGGLITGSYDNSDSDVIDEMNLQEAKFVCAILLMQSLAKFQTLHATFSDLLLTVFSGNWRTSETLVARGLALGINFNAPHQIFAVSSIAQTDADKQTEHHLLRRLCLRLRQPLPIICEDSTYLMLIKLNTYNNDSTAVLGRQMLTAMKPHWGDNLALAVSRICTGLKDYTAARHEIDEVLKLSETFRRTGLIRISDFGGYGLLFSVSGQQRIKRFIDQVISPLEKYDIEKNANMLLTIKAYIDCGCRYQFCADQLCIHVTTLRYRLERIQVVFGIDLSNSDTRFDFDLAFRLRQIS